MRNDRTFTMIHPAPGFTSRVMARIAEQERARARRRAMIGSILLIAFALVVVTLIVVWLVSWVAVFVAMPQLIVSVLSTLATVAFWIGIALDGIATAIGAIAENIGVAQMGGLALTVIALTALWVRVVAGSLFSSQTMTVGG